MKQTKKLTDKPAIPKALLSSMNTALRQGNFSKFLKLLSKLTESYGMSEFSRLSGVDRSQLYEIFSARQFPRLNTFYKIMRVLDLELSMQEKRK